jgi:hypothetical protein
MTRGKKERKRGFCILLLAGSDDVVHRLPNKGPQMERVVRMLNNSGKAPTTTCTDNLMTRIRVHRTTGLCSALSDSRKNLAPLHVFKVGLLACISHAFQGCLVLLGVEIDAQLGCTTPGTRNAKVGR